jgi:acyl dehydratase
LSTIAKDIGTNMTVADQVDSRSRLCLEDLHVGRSFTSASHAMSVEEIKAFARQYDPQPFHLDESAAQDSFFGELVASGWHTAAVTMRLLVGGGLPLAGGVIGAGGELSWPGPTRPGDVLTVYTEITEIKPSRSRPDRGMVTMRSETRNQHGEIAQILVARLVVPRRPA